MISIVTPSFQQLDWLRLAIASVADQDRVEIEHVVQDGGSEGVAELVSAEFSGLVQNNLLRLYGEKDQGMYDAINRGLSKARGEICAYLNCDEQYLPGALAKVEAFFAANPDIDVLFGDAILVRDSGEPISYRRMVLPSKLHLRLAPLNTLTCATFFRRRLIDDGHLFPTHLKVAGDQYWVYSLLKKGVPMAVLREPLAVFTFTGTNLYESERGNEERFGWRPDTETSPRWLTPAVLAWHRMKKAFAGAYRRRDLTVEIYTRDSPKARKTISAAGVGFGWPKS